MFIRLTNAITGKMVTLNPQNIAHVSDRDNAKYPNTKAAVIMNDRNETFYPTIETEDEIHRLIAGAAGGLATARRPANNPPGNDPNDPGPAER